MELPAGGPELVCDPECLWRATSLHGDRRSETERWLDKERGRGSKTGAASYLSIDQRSERQVVKQVCEVLPDVGVPVLPQALIVEAIDLRDLPRLVVPSQDGDSLLETNLNQDEEKKRKLKSKTFCGFSS